MLLNANEVLRLLQWRWHSESAKGLFDAQKVPKNNALLANMGGWGACGSQSAISQNRVSVIAAFQGRPEG